jgi:hypothetical protein
MSSYSPPTRIGCGLCEHTVSNPALHSPRRVEVQRDFGPLLAGKIFVETVSRDSQKNKTQRGATKAQRPSSPSEVRRRFHAALLRVSDDHLAGDPNITPEQIFEALYETAKVVGRRGG